MSRLRYLWLNFVLTLLRVLPFPRKTGLVPIGHPERRSPVLLTGNYRLTVERVKHALAGVDAYLLVANSRGVDVWCAAAGGLLTDHDVISVLKTCGIQDLVDHRTVILPQLAAPGIEGRTIREKTGWNVIWGPVSAAAIPAFLDGGLTGTREMRTVSFPWLERLEMAAAWAFPISLLALLFLPVWRAGVLPLVGLVWGLSILVFWAFPLYQGRLQKTRKNVGFVFFDFGERGVALIFWALFMLALLVYALLTGGVEWGLIARWGLGSAIVLLTLSLDLMGSTPHYKSGLHEDRRLRIALDADRCQGAGDCEQVCPVDVLDVDHVRRLAVLARADRCVQCGACIVQCPFDAFYFRSPDGTVVTPDTIRKYKLNLIGSRKVSGSRKATGSIA